MLTEAEVVDYLLAQGLLTTADIVRGGFVVEDVSRRNRNLAVHTGDSGGLFLKQSDARQSTSTLHREADVYRLLGTCDPRFADRHLPGLRGFDDGRELLVLDHLAEVEPLTAVRVRDPESARACAVELGRALARLHEAPLPESGDFEAPRPWVLSVRRPSRDILADLSSASVSTIKIVQQSTLMCRWLDELLRPNGRASLIHGDMRLDNCLVRVPGEAAAPEDLFLVDWELAGVGDPCWDVGTVIGEYLTAWIRSMPAAPSLSLRDSLALAVHPLDTVLPDIAVFWDAYREQRTGSGQQDDLPVRSVRSAGARLIQSAVESAQTSSQLTATVVYTLQLAENILASPRQAGGRLLGLHIA